MKNKFLVVLTMIMVFGLFATVFALNNKTTSEAAKTESCPMQNQKAQKADDVDMSKVVVVKSAGGDDCCQPGADCCKGGSCCHKKK